MAVRDFTDPHGMPWRVWHTQPSKGGALDHRFARGWLTFESARQVRRLTPVPMDWETLSDTELALLCRAAEEAPPRRHPLEAGRPPQAP